MSNVQITGSNASIVQGTIGTSGTLSEEMDLGEYTLAGLLIDNASNGTLNFWVSHQPFQKPISTGTNSYRPITSSDGTTFGLTLPAGNVAFKATDIIALAPYRYVRLVTSVAQANAPTIRFIVKA